MHFCSEIAVVVTTLFWGALEPTVEWKPSKRPGIDIAHPRRLQPWKDHRETTSYYRVLASLIVAAAGSCGGTANPGTVTSLGESWCRGLSGVMALVEL